MSILSFSSAIQPIGIKLCTPRVGLDCCVSKRKLLMRGFVI
jgi:hypothetical protein